MNFNIVFKFSVDLWKGSVMTLAHMSSGVTLKPNLSHSPQRQQKVELTFLLYCALCSD